MRNMYTESWVAGAAAIAAKAPCASWNGLTEREVELINLLDEPEVPPARTVEEMEQRCPLGDISSWPYCFILADPISETVLARIIGGDGHMYWTVDSPWAVGEDYDPSDELDATRYYVEECQRIRRNLEDHDSGWDLPEKAEAKRWATPEYMEAHPYWH